MSERPPTASASGASKRPLGQRRLAAIMFTDVVGFSARVQANEALSLRLVKRDLALITQACAASGGQVLKSTGDGLLMAFPTAGAAVNCALAVQKKLTQASQSLPPDQLLQHRIGIHLGDVYITDSDVMGNDVNIAARVLSEAGAGEICVSQTVYDVVKHRLSIKGIYLGERELKNISEPLPIFKLPVSGEEIAAPGRRRAAVWIVAGATGATLIAVIAWSLLHRRPGVEDVPIAASQPAAPATATFFDMVRGSGGNWKGRYGALAAIVFGDDPAITPDQPLALPLRDGGSAQITVSGCTVATLPPSVRALESPPVRVHKDERVIAGLAARATMTLHLKLPDAIERRITLYFVDYVNANRVESLNIYDGGSGTLLASRTIDHFNDGCYVSFDVSGDLRMEITLQQGANAVVSGLFVDPAGEESAQPIRSSRRPAPGRRRGG
jgi:class 3 adenylate cyclase